MKQNKDCNIMFVDADIVFNNKQSLTNTINDLLLTNDLNFIYIKISFELKYFFVFICFVLIIWFFSFCAIFEQGNGF